MVLCTCQVQPHICCNSQLNIKIPSKSLLSLLWPVNCHPVSSSIYPGTIWERIRRAKEGILMGQEFNNKQFNKWKGNKQPFPHPQTLQYAKAIISILSLSNNYFAKTTPSVLAEYDMSSRDELRIWHLPKWHKVSFWSVWVSYPACLPSTTCLWETEKALMMWKFCLVTNIDVLSTLKCCQCWFGHQ